MQIDIALLDFKSNEINLLFAYGNMRLSTEDNFYVGGNSFPDFIVAADLNKDHSLDVIVSNAGTNTIVIFLGCGSGSFHNQAIHSTDLNFQLFSVAASNFNNDAQLDIALVNHGTNSVDLLIGYDITGI